MTTQPSATVLLDSTSPAGHRVTTMEVVMHRFVLAEFNTHRAFSRNSASSRAIPFDKMLDRVISDPAVPVSWPAEQRGMQGGEEFDADRRHSANLRWITARDNAVHHACELHSLGVHKSIVNRLLEPFLWHTVIVTGDADGYDNFFKQRCSTLAQPEIRVAANEMLLAYVASKPQELDYGEWHTPLIQPDETDFYGDLGEDMDWVRRRVSAARCARVSYLTHDGKRDVTKDLELYDRLVTADPPHWSPLEHVCTPDPMLSSAYDADIPEPTRSVSPANLRGWVQLRHIVERNRRDQLRVEAGLLTGRQ